MILENKVALVTGGNTGLGMAYAHDLAKNGADIIVASYGNEYSEIEKLVTNLGRKFTYFEVNLLDDEKLYDMAQKAVDIYGKIDILVNNAGTIKRAPLLEHSLDDWNLVIDLNLSSVFKLSQFIARKMKEQGSGKIINVASMLTYQGGILVPGYAASKHGIAGLTKAFANELAQFNIQINAVAPGYVKTANTAPILADEKRNKEILSRIPANRWAEPEDVAGTVTFLASPSSDYINGVVIPVDGGWQAR